MKKNSRKKALLPAVAMALASVIALSGVTYAWFTTGNTAQVSTLDVNVQTANGIQISLDAESWRSNITSKDIKDLIANSGTYSSAENQLPETEILPVSTAGKITDGKMEMFWGEIQKDGTFKSEAEVEQNRTSAGNFVAFDVFVKSSSDQDLTLNLGDDTSYVKGVSIDGSNAAAGAEKAARVAFIPLGNAEEPGAARGLKGTADTKPLIWEPNSKSHVVSGVSGKQDYTGLNQAFEGKDLNTLAGEGLATTVSTFDESKVVMSLKNGINKMRIYIWLEGQDVDCVNQISFGDFTTNLSFSVPEVE